MANELMVGVLFFLALLIAGFTFIVWMGIKLLKFLVNVIKTEWNKPEDS